MALAPVFHSPTMPWYGSPASRAPDPPSSLKPPPALARPPVLKSAMKSATPKAASVTFASPIEKAYELLDFAQTPIDDAAGLRCAEVLPAEAFNAEPPPAEEAPRPVRIAGTGAGPGGRHANMEHWKPAEDHFVAEQLAILGPKWKRIQELLLVTFGKERTVSSVRNRARRIKVGSAQRHIAKNICHKCGQIRRGHICTVG